MPDAQAWRFGGSVPATRRRLPAVAKSGALRTIVIKSRLKKILKSDGFVRVVGINRVAEPWFTELAGKLGFDVAWFDMEHRAYGYDRIDGLSLACRATGIDLMVRIRKNGYTSAMRALEFGANGVMVPHCQSADEARQWVEWTKFPPLGNRGFDGAGADGDYALADPVPYLQQRNDETFLVVQIEDQQAVENAQAIAAVDGVDVLFVGPADLSIDYGVPMQREHRLVQHAMDKVAEAAARAGKWWGTVTNSPAEAQKELARGARMITCADDHFLLVKGLQDAQRQFESVRIP
jgi:4-hydroxy-2-oxoheptanedioate aldolase